MRRHDVRRDLRHPLVFPHFPQRNSNTRQGRINGERKRRNDRGDLSLTWLKSTSFAPPASQQTHFQPLLVLCYFSCSSQVSLAHKLTVIKPVSSLTMVLISRLFSLPIARGESVVPRQKLRIRIRPNIGSVCRCAQLPSQSTDPSVLSFKPRLAP